MIHARLRLGPARRAHHAPSTAGTVLGFFGGYLLVRDKLRHQP
ncbi:hypothetical protein [uncultured Pseudonocardia sp.]|nr:hypothetical protein [uncultured Pseudonocardia sp.]